MSDLGGSRKVGSKYRGRFRERKPPGMSIQEKLARAKHDGVAVAQTEKPRPGQPPEQDLVDFIGEEDVRRSTLVREFIERGFTQWCIEQSLSKAIESGAIHTHRHEVYYVDKTHEDVTVSRNDRIEKIQALMDEAALLLRGMQKETHHGFSKKERLHAINAAKNAASAMGNDALHAILHSIGTEIEEET